MKRFTWMAVLFAALFGSMNPLPLQAQTRIELAKHLSATASVPLSSVASSIRNIPLETTDDCLLSNELAVCCTATDIFVLDRQATAVYRFSINGKLQNRIGKQGQGPGEYIRPTSLYVDKETRTVFVLDGNNQKFYLYDFAGKFIRSFKMECFSYTMEKVGSDYVYANAFYDKQKQELVKMNAGGTLLKSLNSTYKAGKGISIEVPFFYAYRSKVYYKVPIDNRVYEVDADLKKHPVYQFELGSYTPNPEERQIVTRQNQGKVELQKGAVIIWDLSESDSHLLISYSFNKTSAMAVYEKQTGKISIPKTGEAYGWKDDLSQGPAVRFDSNTAGHRCSTEANQVVSLIYPSALDWDKYKQGSFAKTLQTMSEDDNPIIQIVTLKTR
ncbi:MAG: 6-bladed beta-propeller [Parabacteroides sp.]